MPFHSSDKAVLASYINQIPLKIMRSNNFIDITELMTVAQDFPRVQYRRSLEAERALLNDKKRRIIRAMNRCRKRNEAFIYRACEPRPKYIHCHSVPMSSKSTKNEFNLLIERETQVNSNYSGNPPIFN